MNLKEKIENNPVLLVLGLLLAGFIAGVGVYKALHEMVGAARPGDPSAGAAVESKLERALAENKQLEAKLQKTQEECGRFRVQLARLESMLRIERSEGDSKYAHVSATPAPTATSVKSAQGFDFVLEGCVAEASDLNCWIEVTNRRERRVLKVFVDGSRLTDQNDNAHEMRRALESDDSKELNILRLDLASGSTGRFGLHFAGLGGHATSLKLLVVHTMDFDLEWRSVEVQ
jgi:hypothetical protein